ncbi:hypothetical protein HRbin09_00828 [bacterium HR09]|nr:hypothetical protein HRbin09_00828 [bacterium HR09]
MDGDTAFLANASWGGGENRKVEVGGHHLQTVTGGGQQHVGEDGNGGAAFQDSLQKLELLGKLRAVEGYIHRSPSYGYDPRESLHVFVEAVEGAEKSTAKQKNRRRMGLAGS